MKDFDFSNYKIYLPNDGCAGNLLAPNEDSYLLEKKYIYSFDEGIKKLQEEKRGIYWLNDLSNRKMSEYFRKKYNIFMP